MDVYSHWVDAVEEHVDSEVVLEVIDEMGLVQVVLDYVAPLGRAVLDDPLAVA